MQLQRQIYTKESDFQRNFFTGRTITPPPQNESFHTSYRPAWGRLGIPSYHPYFCPSINTNILNFQDKAQILTELNNNISKFTSGIPKLINKVNEAVNKIYGNTENPIKKAINNHPFVIMASKATHKAIKNNMGNIVENIIDDLIMELKQDLDDIDEKERKRILMDNFGKTKMKLNALKQDEIITLKKYSNI